MLKTAGFLCALCFYGCFKNNPLKLLWPYGLGISILSIIFFGERERELCYETVSKVFFLLHMTDCLFSVKVFVTRMF